MEFYFLVMCMLLDLKSKQMRKSKILKCEIRKIKSKRGKVVEQYKELKYHKGSIRLLNTVIRNVKRLSKRTELEDFEIQEKNEETFEET